MLEFKYHPCPIITEQLNALKKVIKDNQQVVYDSAAVLADNLFQWLADVHDITIVTNSDEFSVYIENDQPDAAGVIKDIDLLHTTMKITFGDLYKGGTYTPSKSEFSFCTIIYSQGGDWEVIYIDGKSVYQGHECNRYTFLQLTEEWGIVSTDITQYEASDSDEDQLLGTGHFPENSVDLLSRYNKENQI